MNIRPETPSDYAAIAAVNIRAFGQRLAESQIVTLHRQRRCFDANLSLVAEVDDQVVGHVLFTPQRLRLLGQTIEAVILAPIAVDPACQKQGVGGALIEAGHAAAREKGAAFAMLIGHPTYYPRFGYVQNAFGGGGLGLWSAKAEPLVSRPLLESDLPQLHELWLAQEGDVDFALEPEPTMVDWLSPNPAVRAIVYERDGEVVGYCRIHSARPTSPTVFLARDAAIARSMVWLLAGGGAQVSLPLHPAAPWAAELGQAGAAAWDVAMVRPLNDSPFDDYMQQVAAGTRAPGRPIWSTAFEVE